MNNKRIVYADDQNESVQLLIRLRAFPLLIGLILGLGISFVTSSFEEVISQNVHVVFFMPFIVYIASALGTQTESIYARALKTGKAQFHTYLKKECLVGISFGILIGIIATIATFVWLQDTRLSASVGISSFLAVASAPPIALCVTEIFQRLKEDPATGSGPVATVIQDIISIVIYGMVASLIIL